MFTIMGEDGVDDKSVKKNDTISVRGQPFDAAQGKGLLFLL